MCSMRSWGRSEGSWSPTPSPSRMEFGPLTDGEKLSSETLRMYRKKEIPQSKVHQDRHSQHRIRREENEVEANICLVSFTEKQNQIQRLFITEYDLIRNWGFPEITSNFTVVFDNSKKESDFKFSKKLWTLEVLAWIEIASLFLIEWPVLVWGV